VGDAARAVAALRELGSRALTAASRDDIVEAVVDTVHAALPVDQVHFSEVSQDAAVGQARVVAFEPVPHPVERYTHVLVDRPSATATVVASGESLHIPDARGSEALRSDLSERFHVGSALFVPLRRAGEVRFVMILIRHEVRPFNDDEIAAAEALADHAAVALALQETEEVLAARTQRDAALARAAAALNHSSSDLPSLLEAMAREADLAVGGDMSGIYLGDPTTGGVATAGHNSPANWHGLLMRPGEGVAGQVLATGRPAISNAYQTDVRLPANAGLQRLQTAVSVPLKWGRDVKGALSVGFIRMRRIGPSDLRTLEAIADLAAVALRTNEIHRTAETPSSIDTLTGLLDHGALHARLREEIARTRREGADLACLVIGLDDFSAVNERAGHLLGDDVLARAGSALRKVLRPYDTVARFGGDEFAVVLPRTPLDRARELARRIREALAAVTMPADSPPLQCTIGVATWQEPLEAAQLLDATLADLRDAKAGGGDG
jgi:diguanylate cyclase (GGDEF)-like protein